MKSKFLIITIFVLAVLSVSTFGADRALVIGIDHYSDEKKCNSSMDNSNEGCVTPTYGGIADAVSTRNFLIKRFGFSKNEIRVLKGRDATANAIRSGFENWLISGSKRGDRIFVFYSGHGARVKDDGFDEEDKRDEILAPYDVQTRPTIANFIRDDEINQWLAALSGRQVVMVIDSCHSGTISRSASSKKKNGKFSKYLVTENVPVTRGGFADIFSKVPKKTRTRDLSTVVDKYMTGKFPNVVVISAAQAYQQAVWIDSNGSTCGVDPPNAKYRGALSYIFEKIYSYKNPTLKQLDYLLRQEMLKIGENGTNQLCPAETGYQIPEIEFDNSFANSTLWGMGNAQTLTPSWENAAIAALQNPLSKIKVEINFSSASNAYRIGQPINYSISVSERVYLYVVVFSRNKVATVIFPNSKNCQNYKNKGTYNFGDAEAQPPLGKDVWVAIASKRQIRGLENLPLNKQFTWQEVYDRIGVNELGKKLEEIARTRGVGVSNGKIKPSDWQTAIAVTKTLPKQ